MRRELRTVVRATQHPNIGRRARLRIRKHAMPRMARRQRLALHPSLKFHHLLWKIFAGITIWVEQLCRFAITAWRAAHAQIDAAWRQGIESPELFSHFQ